MHCFEVLCFLASTQYLCCYPGSSPPSQCDSSTWYFQLSEDFKCALTAYWLLAIRFLEASFKSSLWAGKPTGTFQKAKVMTAGLGDADYSAGPNSKFFLLS